MAKRKTNVSTESKAAPAASHGPAGPAEGAEPAAKNAEPAAKNAGASTSAARKRGLCQDEIGMVAGEVWHALSQKGGQNLTTLKKSVDAPGDLVVAAIGWLAREGKLQFDTSGRTAKLSLR